jgi:hypothetical protein
MTTQIKTATETQRAPSRATWFTNHFACGTTRHRLYIDGLETPYFVDKASVRAHFTCGHPVGLFGSGLGEEKTRMGGETYRIAASFGGFDRISDAKKKAIEFATKNQTA